MPSECPISRVLAGEELQVIVPESSMTAGLLVVNGRSMSSEHCLSSSMASYCASPIQYLGKSTNVGCVIETVNPRCFEGSKLPKE